MRIRCPNCDAPRVVVSCGILVEHHVPEVIKTTTEEHSAGPVQVDVRMRCPYSFAKVTFL